MRQNVTVVLLHKVHLGGLPQDIEDAVDVAHQDDVRLQFRLDLLQQRPAISISTRVTAINHVADLPPP